MKNRQASFLQEGPLVGVDDHEETRRTWQGPRFELDDGPNEKLGLRFRQTLSALTLAMLVVVGGVGFFHKILPQIIEANEAKQAAKAKKHAVKDAKGAAAVAAEAPPKQADPAEEAMRKFDEQQRQAAEDSLNAARDRMEEHLRQFEQRRAEQWRQHQEFIERHRKRHEEAIGGFRGIPGGFDHLAPDSPDSAWKGAPAEPPKVRFKELRN